MCNEEARLVPSDDPHTIHKCKLASHEEQKEQTAAKRFPAVQPLDVSDGISCCRRRNSCGHISFRSVMLSSVFHSKQSGAGITHDAALPPQINVAKYGIESVYQLIKST